jgi:hypothetical protein
VFGGEGSRVGADRFESAIAQIESAVADSCAEQIEWPARVAAGIDAAIEFLIAHPGAARALAIHPRSGGGEENADYPEMIGRFAGLLGEGAPRAERQPASSDSSVVSVIAAIVSCHVRAGTIESLGEADHDLVFLALLPYLGFREANRWSTTV